MAKFVETVATINSATRTFLVLAVLVLLSIGFWYGYTTYHSQDIKLKAQERELATATAEVARLAEENLAKQRRIEQLEVRLKLLKVDRRVARLEVVRQTPAEGDAPGETTIRFVELTESGEPLGEPKTMTLAGDMVFVNYRVVKFEDELVETEDPLRSTSICLIQKIFGEFQTPADGFVIDRAGDRPRAYGLQDETSELEQEIWTNFWDLANDPDQARSHGIRAIHEESPSMRVRPGRRYELEIRSSGGLTIKPLSDPAES